MSHPVFVMAMVLWMLSTAWPAQAQESSGAHAPGAIVAGRFVTPEGNLKTSATVLLSKGYIKSISSDAVTPDRQVDHYPDGVLCPGLIDVGSILGAEQRNSESVDAVDASASAVDLLDLAHPHFARARQAGVTSVVISPAPNNLVSGLAVVTKTAAAGIVDPVLRSEGPLVFSLGDPALLWDRAPTSRGGALAMLRKVLGDAREGQGHDRLARFVRGQGDGLVHCANAMDVDAALDVFAGMGRRVSFAFFCEETDFAARMSAADRMAVVAPLTFDESPRRLAVPGVLRAASVEVAFAGALPEQPWDSLRISAHLAVRYGMEPAAARRGLSAVPAKLAGVEDRVGAIRPGLHADLVVFSDDPLRLDARVLAVYVNGVRVFQARTEVGGAPGGARTEYSP